MSATWFKNFVGLRPNDFEMLQVPNPKLEFGIHVTIRSVQTGALIGSLLGPSLYLLNNQANSNRQGCINSFVSGGSNGAALGAIMGPILTYISVRDMNTISLYDKCYRLRFNEDYLRQDRAAVLSAAVGLLSSGSTGLVVGLDLSLLFVKLMSLGR
uniref:MFS domain-containing protein n=2 Tax=Caenorhabditis tropicalis TaxID=1561998 RepID=A0A1I7UIW4_9PELO